MLQAAAAATYSGEPAASSDTAMAAGSTQQQHPAGGGEQEGAEPGALSWTVALQVIAAMHSLPALAGFALRSAFERSPCDGTALAAGGTGASLLSTASAAAACILATVIWRQTRAGGVGTGSGDRGGAGGGFIAAAHQIRASLGGSGWRRLKSTALTSAVVQLSVMACIDWAAAAVKIP